MNKRIRLFKEREAERAREKRERPFQQNLRVWIGERHFVRCAYISKWELPYHIHYGWNSGRQGYTAQKATHCHKKTCRIEEWKYRHTKAIDRVIDELNTVRG